MIRYTGTPNYKVIVHTSKVSSEVDGYNKECNMAKTVAQMTIDEFRTMLDALLEQKLLEILGDPDEGLEIRDSLRERLIRQREEVVAGERGQSLNFVAKAFDIE
jgi:hypothetical protein